MALNGSSQEIKMKHSTILYTHFGLGLVAFITIVIAKVVAGHHDSPVLLKAKERETQNEKIEGDSFEMAVEFCSKAAD